MTAQAWAAAVQPDTPVQWRGLEVAAFDGHPEVVHTIDPRGEYAPQASRRGPFARAFSGIGTVVMLITIIVGTVVLGFPTILALATLMGDRFNRSHPDPHATVPIAGVILAFAFVMLVISFVSWVRRGRGRDLLREAQALTAVLFGVPCVFLAATRGSAAGVANWQWWTAVMVLSSVAGATYLVPLLIAHRADNARRLKARMRGESELVDGLPREPTPKVQAELDRVPAVDQDTIRSDVAAAIDDLETRTVISTAEASVARAAGLGALALRMQRLRQREVVEERKVGT